MKTIVKAFINLFVFSILFASCNKDTSENDYDSYVTYKGNTKELTKGYIEVDDYYITLVLFSENIDIDFENGGMTGTGAVVYFDLFSALETELSPGIYTTDTDLNQSIDIPMYFQDSGLSTPVAFYSDEGSLEVTQGGLENISLTFTIKDSEGKLVTGKWTGNLTVIN